MFTEWSGEIHKDDRVYTMTRMKNDTTYVVVFENGEPIYEKTFSQLPAAVIMLENNYKIPAEAWNDATHKTEKGI